MPASPSELENFKRNVKALGQFQFHVGKIREKVKKLMW
jgi:hypothetical protein